MNQNELEQEERERTVLKYTTSQNFGVESTRLTRNAIGYILRGEKYIHDDDRPLRIGQGEIFFFSQGTHYVENIPATNDTFEQIVFYYSPSRMQQIIATLNTSEMDLNTKVKRDGISSNVASATPSKITRNFFLSTNRHYEYGGFLHNEESERIHLMELTYIILTQEMNSMRDLLLQSLDTDKAEFEKIIYRNMLTDKSVDELAAECNRSLTSFKKEFKRVFGAPPHQWYLRQRLNYSKLLLNTTQESISHIGNICAFPNTSHFIKLFKRYFEYTPAVYRSTHKGGVAKEEENNASNIEGEMKMEKEVVK